MKKKYTNLFDLEECKTEGAELNLEERQMISNSCKYSRDFKCNYILFAPEESSRTKYLHT